MPGIAQMWGRLSSAREELASLQQSASKGVRVGRPANGDQAIEERLLLDRPRRAAPRRPGRASRGRDGDGPGLMGLDEPDPLGSSPNQGALGPVEPCFHVTGHRPDLAARRPDATHPSRSATPEPGGRFSRAERLRFPAVRASFRAARPTKSPGVQRPCTTGRKRDGTTGAFALAWAWPPEVISGT